MASPILVHEFPIEYGHFVSTESTFVRFIWILGLEDLFYKLLSSSLELGVMPGPPVLVEPLSLLAESPQSHLKLCLIFGNCKFHWPQVGGCSRRTDEVILAPD